MLSKEEPLNDCGDHGYSYYRLPFGSESGWKLFQGNLGDPGGAHGAGQRYCFDFGFDPDNNNIGNEGTHIRAARTGVVYQLVSIEFGNVKDDNPPGYKMPGNYLIVRHFDGTYTVYWHIRQYGVLVDVGDIVERGDVIGIVGNTRNSDFPHIHFGVTTGWTLTYWEDFAANGYAYEFENIQIRLQDKNHTYWIPHVIDTLASNNS